MDTEAELKGQIATAQSLHANEVRMHSKTRARAEVMRVALRRLGESDMAMGVQNFANAALRNEEAQQ